MSKASTIIGTVAMNHIKSVLTIDFQNIASLIRNSKFLKPTNSISPMPSQLDNAKYTEKTTGNKPNIKNVMKNGEISK